MATLTDYKGLDVVEDATGDGGVTLTDNFKELADRAPYQAAGNPGVNDDSTLGFSPGDQWLNTSTQVLWACVSNSTGAAAWKSILKRTASVLELIPLEETDSVVIAGNLNVNAKIGVGRAATASPIEIQQASGDTVVGLRVYRSDSAVFGGLSVSPGGNFLAQRSNSNTLLSIGGNFGGFQSAGHGVAVTAAGFGISTNIALFSPTCRLDVDSDKMRLRTSKTPASASDTGNQGDICWDDDYVYVCVATDTWKRSALTTW